MRRILLATPLLLLLAASFFPRPAQALYICVSVLDFDECHPRNGAEPPAWCGDYHPLWGGLERLNDWIEVRLDDFKPRLPCLSEFKSDPKFARD